MRMESLPHDVVELILERLPVKSLLRFKAVSKEWRSTIESSFFQERQLVQRKQSGDPDVLMVPKTPFHAVGPDLMEPLITLVLGSSASVKIPSPLEKTHYLVCKNTCDGLVCVYQTCEPCLVFNPTTRWHRTLPLYELQKYVIGLGKEWYFKLSPSFFNLGFGKDKLTGTYKPVCLYNSKEIGRQNATTCEVFDFCTNSWRYVTPAAPYRINNHSNPVYVDGSLHWLTECKETNVLSFDLHKESFQVVSKAPFADLLPYEMVLCNLDERLCVSALKWPEQVIWSFSSGNKSWEQMYSLDLDYTYRCHDIPTRLFAPHIYALMPLALLHGEKEKKKKLLFYDDVLSRKLVIYDPETKSCDAAYSAEVIGYTVCYFQSLFSI
ncbi:unnamed protein product [Microthlaspi erraticum]|uniref:F-box domain-containing protein n=1 Tax=Microthlaspi erraticum TaxID=1685480 RepID=A0A6D2JH21_9BRAS|nr:unnamed protein product [Microthlaspi erraticum]